MSRIVQRLAGGSAAALLAACSAVQDVRDDIAVRAPIAREAINVPVTRAPSPNVIEVGGARLGYTEVPYYRNSGAWLRQKSFSYRAPTPVPLSQVIAAIAAKGVNITSDMPLDNVTFTGQVNMTNLENGLRQVLGNAGYDYTVDDSAQIVTIQALPSRTWTLPIRDRSSSFSSGGQGGIAQQGGGGLAGATPQGGTQGAMAGGQGSGGQGNGSQGGNQGNGNETQANGAGNEGNTATPGGSQNGSFAAVDSPWAKLKNELNDRLSVMVPAPRQGGVGMALQPGMPLPSAAGPLPATLNMPQAMGGMGQGGEQAAGGELYVRKKIGHFALNPNTGAVTVSAPHWVLDTLDPYFRRTADALNTLISFKGMMILVSKTRENSESIDIQSFASWASGRYGAVISNNTLGGVTVNFANGKIPSVSTGNPTLGGPALGVVSELDGLKIFNNYMEQYGNTYVVQEPRIATTSGVAGKFSNIVSDFYTRITQSTAAGNTGAAVQGIDNQMVPIRLGTELSVYPTFDPVTGIVRALIVSKSVVQDGTKNLPQFLNAGLTAQQINQPVPIPRELLYEGEALLRDGDLIVFGGQSEENLRTSEAGLPGRDGPLGGLLGNKKATRGGGTYYFALKVSISKL